MASTKESVLGLCYRILKENRETFEKRGLGFLWDIIIIAMSIIGGFVVLVYLTVFISNAIFYLGFKNHELIAIAISSVILIVVFMFISIKLIANITKEKWKR